MKKTVSLFLFLLYALIVPAQNLYDPDNSRQFAEYLIRTKQYPLAVIELERLVYFLPQNDTLKKKLIYSYSLNRAYPQALNRLRSFSPDPLQLDSAFSSYYAYNLIADKQFSAAGNYVAAAPSLNTENKLYYQAWNYLFQKDFKNAHTILSVPQANTPLLIPLREIAVEGVNVPRKSPGLALAMSAIVPGSGKFYARERKDAIISFIAIGALAVQSYRGFNKNGVESVRGWVYGGIGAGFYLGNLYGSFKAAKRYNDRKLNHIISRIEDAYYLHP